MSAGLPQLDAALYPEQIFWLAVSFAVLYCLMAYVALPAVRRTQDKRAETIASELAAAARANEEAKATIAHYEKALAEARAKAQANVNQIAAQAAKDAADKQAAQQRELAKHLAGAEGKITSARDAAIRDVESTAGELAKSIVEKVTGKKEGAVHGA